MKPYRRNVGVVVFNSRGQVLAGERYQSSGRALQFPQGGLDDGEAPLAGARRELYEETGLQMQGEPVAELAGWLRYDFPPDVPEKLQRYQGQEQKWFFYYWDGAPESLPLDHHEREFERLLWSDFREVAANIVAFKRQVYATLLRQGEAIIAAHLRAMQS